MKTKLNGLKVAILVSDCFEERELTEPRKALDEAGATTFIVSPDKDVVHGCNHFKKGGSFKVDVPLDQAKADDFDALLLPGGVISPDHLRMQPKAVEFVRKFGEQGKPIGSMCRGPWTLIEAGLIRGKTVTSWPSIKTDLRNAGANWVDRDVVVDQGLVTSRMPDDIPAFNIKLIEQFALGLHASHR